MAKHNIGSLVVLRPGDHQCIAGIVTERGRFFLYVLSTECSKTKSVMNTTQYLKILRLWSPKYLLKVIINSIPFGRCFTVWKNYEPKF